MICKILIKICAFGWLFSLNGLSRLLTLLIILIGIIRVLVSYKVTRFISSYDTGKDMMIDIVAPVLICTTGCNMVIDILYLILPSFITIFLSHCFAFVFFRFVYWSTIVNLTDKLLSIYSFLCLKMLGYVILHNRMGYEDICFDTQSYQLF